MSSQSLPSRPSLEFYKKQAKALHKSHSSGEAEAIARIQKNLPRLSQASETKIRSDDFKLSDAQLVIARENGFDSWPKLQQEIQSQAGASDNTPELLEQFKTAVQERNASALKDLLTRHPSLKKVINEPLFSFDSPALVAVASAGNRALIDVLLDAGADINLRSSWWAGGFGVLDHSDPESAKYLIERGAIVDVHAAARLAMMDRLKELIEADPDLVHARGGDGQTPLHFAANREVAEFLLSKRADIDARDIDHEGTPAQTMVRDRQDVCRYLISRGAEPDIFMACMLGDMDLAKRVLDEDLDALQGRIGQGKFAAKKSDGGHIYFYTIGGRQRPILVAASQGHKALVDFLLKHASSKERFLAACLLADEETVRSIVAAEPQIIQSLPADDISILPDAAAHGQSKAVRVMLDSGFDVAARGDHNATPLHWAGWFGYIDTVNVILEFTPPLEDANASLGTTPLQWTVHGSVNCRNRKGDYVGVVKRLIDAGAKVDPAWAEMGSKEVAKVILEAAK